jgi:hypothetical protein
MGQKTVDEEHGGVGLCGRSSHGHQGAIAWWVVLEVDSIKFRLPCESRFRKAGMTRVHACRPDVFGASFRFPLAGVGGVA